MYSFIPLIGLKFCESILFEYGRVFMYLISKNITIIKKIFLIRRFFPEKSWTQIMKVNITFVFQEFYTRIFFLLLSLFFFFFG